MVRDCHDASGDQASHARHVLVGKASELVGVALEIAALPLIHGALVTAILFSVLNAIVMAARISVESRALAAAEP